MLRRQFRLDLNVLRGMSETAVDAAHAPDHGGYSCGCPRPCNQLEKYKKEEDEMDRIAVSKNEKTKQRRLIFYPLRLIVVYS